MGNSLLNKRTRVPELDILKGIGIFIMVVNHVKFGSIVTHYIRSFSMPLFFIVSGFLWRDKGESIFRRLKLRARKLLLPYFAFGVFFCLARTILDLLSGDTSGIAGYWLNLFLYSNQELPFSTPLWFFPCMVLADLFFICIYRLVVRVIGQNASDRKRNVVFGLAITVVAILGCIYSSIESLPVLFWSCEPALTAIFFMYYGYILRRVHDMARIDVLHLKPIPLLVLFCLGAVLSIFSPLIDMRTARYCIVPLYFLNGCLQTTVWFNFSGILMRLSEKDGGAVSRFSQIAKRIFTYFSTDSISFVCMNYALIHVFRYVLSRFPASPSRIVSLAESTVILVLVLVLIMLINEVIKRTPFRIIIGKEEKNQIIELKE